MQVSKDLVRIQEVVVDFFKILKQPPRPTQEGFGMIGNHARLIGALTVGLVQEILQPQSIGTVAFALFKDPFVEGTTNRGQGGCL